MDIYEWNDIKNDFSDGIILGNGASIAVDENFSYPTLFDTAVDTGLVTEPINKIFSHFDSEDFELVLRMLWHSYNINEALGVEEEATENAYQNLRKALIKAIHEIHIEYNEAKQNLMPIANFLKNFETVFSLNYDFLVYWSILKANSEWGANWFKDCFVQRSNEFAEDYGDFLDPPDNGAEKTIYVFYPHGNLCLASELFGGEKKLIRSELGEDLLHSVVQKWNSDRYSPLFVSEGTSDQKLNAINRSPYLSFIYQNVFNRELSESIVIYGWSMSNSDDHILEKICKHNSVKRIAVSVLKDKKVEKRCRRKRQRINEKSDHKIEVKFFNAKSEGSWIY